MLRKGLITMKIMINDVSLLKEYEYNEIKACVCIFEDRIYFLLLLVIHGFKHIHLNANLAQVLTLDAEPI